MTDRREPPKTLRQISAAMLASPPEAPPPEIDADEAQRARQRGRDVLAECRDRMRKMERQRT